MKRLSILGATGSIGRSTLDLVDRMPERLQVVALTAGRNIELLAQQIRRFRPRMAAVIDARDADRLARQLAPDHDIPILHGHAGLKAAAELPQADMVVTAVVGAAGLMPTLAAIDAGKAIALANKETLVVAGELVTARARARQVPILPVDSEHSAIFQCLQGNRRQDAERILLTASGGPFRQRPAATFHAIGPADALRHPNWSMGRKITIDSATLMNKGLEVIEARWLFDMSFDGIEVVVHPQSIVHSMVAYRDGSVMAQLGVPDMRGAIGYALAYPQRWPLPLPPPDFAALGQLTFEAPDRRRFPCLDLAFAAGRAGGTLPAVLNAANEEAVEAFLESRLGFTAIAQVIEETLAAHSPTTRPDLDDLLEADRWARESARRRIQKLGG